MNKGKRKLEDIYVGLDVGQKKGRKVVPSDKLGNFRKPSKEQIEAAEKFLSHRDVWDEVKSK